MLDYPVLDHPVLDYPVLDYPVLASAAWGVCDVSSP